MLVEELTQLRDDHRVDAGMPSALALAQALLRCIVAHAVEALGAIEVEVVAADARLQSQKALDALQLGHRVVDQLVAVHHQDLTALEYLQPAVHVQMVDGDGDRSVGLVYTAVRTDHQLLEAALLVHGVDGCVVVVGVVAVVGGRGRGGGVAAELRVVGDRTGHRLAHDQHQPHARVHRVDALRYLCASTG